MAIAAKFIQQPGKTHQTDGDDEVRELTGSQILCEALIREGVELLYGYPGGTIMPFYDALTSYSALHHVLVRHEQALWTQFLLLLSPVRWLARSSDVMLFRKPMCLA